MLGVRASTYEFWEDPIQPITLYNAEAVGPGPTLWEPQPGLDWPDKEMVSEKILLNCVKQSLACLLSTSLLLTIFSTSLF